MVVQSEQGSARAVEMGYMKMEEGVKLPWDRGRMVLRWVRLRKKNVMHVLREAVVGESRERDDGKSDHSNSIYEAAQEATRLRMCSGSRE